MTDPTVVMRKLAVLHEHLDRARRRRPGDLDALRTDVDLQDALALSVMVAIQGSIDIAFHVASDNGYGIPGSYAEAFEILGRHAVIPEGLVHQLAGAAGLRNRIAHGYAAVDVERLWTELPRGLDALERYATAIARHLGKDAGSG